MPPTLPQLAGDRLFLTDGGLETSLIFHDGIDLPDFAAFTLLDDDAGRAALRAYFAPYLAAAREYGAGFLLDTPTWRANPDWGRGSDTMRPPWTGSTATRSASRRSCARRRALRRRRS